MRLTNCAFIVAALSLLLVGCAAESTVTAVILYEHTGAKLLSATYNGASGTHVLCDKGQIVIVQSDRLLWLSTRTETKVPTTVSKCTTD